MIVFVRFFQNLLLCVNLYLLFMFSYQCVRQYVYVSQCSRYLLNYTVPQLDDLGVVVSTFD